MSCWPTAASLKQDFLKYTAVIFLNFLTVDDEYFNDQEWKFILNFQYLWNLHFGTSRKEDVTRTNYWKIFAEKKDKTAHCAGLDFCTGWSNKFHGLMSGHTVKSATHGQQGLVNT